MVYSVFETLYICQPDVGWLDGCEFFFGRRLWGGVKKITSVSCDIFG